MTGSPGKRSVKLTRTKRVLFSLICIVAPIVLALAVLEGGGRLFLLSRPSYEVIFLEPDPLVGWKQFPDHHYVWAGTHWYARNFSVPIETNSHGFRDRDRGMSKPAGVVRVALLGDSFVEALQVPFDKTAAQLLERALNESATAPGARPRYEVLNFGISNYGVGQYLLVWEAYVRAFDPDYVFIFVARLQLGRTVQGFEVGAFPRTRDKTLWVRPTFRLDGPNLIREPARDYDAFVRVQRELISGELNGRRSRMRERSLVGHYMRQWWPAPGPVTGNPARELPPAGNLFVINQKIIQELGRQVHGRGAQLVVVDASVPSGPRRRPASKNLNSTLAELCGAEGFGYVPLHAKVQEARSRGMRAYMAGDGHFSEAGNEIFADALYTWMREHAGDPR
jgi:lysophospholipase L1-like esterase